MNDNQKRIALIIRDAYSGQAYRRERAYWSKKFQSEDPNFNSLLFVWASSKFLKSD